VHERDADREYLLLSAGTAAGELGVGLVIGKMANTCSAPRRRARVCSTKPRAEIVCPVSV
jgi:hypothetical protein